MCWAVDPQWSDLGEDGRARGSRRRISVESFRHPRSGVGSRIGGGLHGRMTGVLASFMPGGRHGNLDWFPGP